MKNSVNNTGYPHHQNHTNGSSSSKTENIIQGNSLPQLSLVEIDHIITARERKRIIKKIFRNDWEDYRRITNLINLIPSWKAAFKLLELCFKERGVDPYSKEAQVFSNIVYHRYYP